MKHKRTIQALFLCSAALSTSLSSLTLAAGGENENIPAAGMAQGALAPATEGIGITDIFGRTAAYPPGFVLNPLHSSHQHIGDKKLSAGSTMKIGLLFRQEFHHDLNLVIPTLDMTLADMGRAQGIALPLLQLSPADRDNLRNQINQIAHQKLVTGYKQRIQGTDIFSPALLLQDTNDLIMNRIFNYLSHQTTNRTLRNFMQTNFEPTDAAPPFQPRAGAVQDFTNAWKLHVRAQRAAQPPLPTFTPGDWKSLVQGFKRTAWKDYDKLDSANPEPRVVAGVARSISTILRRKPDATEAEKQQARLIEGYTMSPSDPTSPVPAVNAQLLRGTRNFLANIMANRSEADQWGQQLMDSTTAALAFPAHPAPDAPAGRPPGQQNLAIAPQYNNANTNRGAVEAQQEGFADGGTSFAQRGIGTAQLPLPSNHPAYEGPNPAVAGAAAKNAKQASLAGLFEPGSYLGDRLATLRQQPLEIRRGSEKEDTSRWLEHQALLNTQDTVDALEGALQAFHREKVGTELQLPEELRQTIRRQVSDNYRQQRMSVGAQDSIESFAANLETLRTNLLRDFYEALYTSGQVGFLSTHFQSYAEAGDIPFVPKDEHVESFRRLWKTHLQRVIANPPAAVLDASSSEVAREYYQNLIQAEPAGNEGDDDPRKQKRRLQGKALLTDMMFHLAPVEGEDAAYVATQRAENRLWHLSPFKGSDGIQERNQKLHQISLAHRTPGTVLSSQTLLQAYEHGQTEGHEAPADPAAEPSRGRMHEGIRGSGRPSSSHTSADGASSSRVGSRSSQASSSNVQSRSSQSNPTRTRSSH